MKESKIKKTIVILSILLGLVLLLLLVVIGYQNYQERMTHEVLKENYINKEEEDNQSTSPSSGHDFPFLSHRVYAEEVSTVNDTTLAIYKGNPEVGEPFKVTNMFPGDTETKKYLVSVSYKNNVKIHFSVYVRPGYEKLSEVMMMRVEMPDHGGVLYDGLMCNMKDEVVTSLTGSQSSQLEDLSYVITAYVDTSVGNDYQDTTLIADFKWWAEDEGNLTPPTGIDRVVKVIWPILLVIVALIFIFVMKRQRKDGSHEVR